MRLVLVLGILMAAAAFVLAADSGDAIPADGGAIQVTTVTRSSVQIEYRGKVIQVNPVGKYDNVEIPFVGKFDALKPADLILISDPPPATIMTNGEMMTVAGISIEATPMYNLLHGPKAGEVYQPKSRGNGYILTLGGKRLYLMGDTECTPEVCAVKNVDVAFVPMNMPYTMTPAEAVECVMALQPKIVYPYHYEGQRRDETLFRAFLKSTPVDVRINTKG